MIRSLTFIALAISLSLSLKAQYVSIPDSNFRAELQYLYPNCFNSSGQMDTTCNDILTATSITVQSPALYCAYMQDLEGIQYFKHLRSVTINNLCLLYTPFPPSVDSITAVYSSGFRLPPNLKYLNASFGQWPNNTPFPETLQEIYLRNEDLGILPALPPNLKVLDVGTDYNQGYYYNNLTQLPELPATLRYLNCMWNRITSLPTLPPSLTYLNCENYAFGTLSELPELPPLLDTLELAGQRINNMPALPASLTFLSCFGSEITSSFPALPNGLKFFRLKEAPALSSLPALPNSITEMHLGNLGLTGLPALPQSLQKLIINFDTLLTSLPAIPSGLENLYCINTGITTLPPLPAGLQYITCSYNKLTGLPALPVRLKMLDCSQNKLTSLPAIPDSVITLIAIANELTSTPSMSNSMMSTLSLSYNHLTNITNLPPTLNALYCNNNQLLSLPALPASLDTMDCHMNLLHSLPDISHTSLVAVSCTYNLLESLPALPASLIFLDCSYNNNLYCLPQIPFNPDCALQINLDTSRIRCIPNKPARLVTTASPILTDISAPSNVFCFSYDGNPDFVYYFYGYAPLPLCTPVNNEMQCEALPVVSGNIFYDINNNGIKDNNERYQPYKRVQFSNNNYTFTNNEGYYEIAADSTGNFTLTAQPPAYFYSFNPAFVNYHFINYDTAVSRDFPMYANRIFDSVAINIIPVNWASRPGFPYPYYIQYEDAATTAMNPVITIQYDNTKLIYDSSSVTGVTNDGTALHFNAGAMAPAESNHFMAYFRIQPSAALGDSIRVSATITGNTATANSVASTEIRGAFDPNDKQATPQLSPAQVSSGKYIDYTIRFQNTGTDTAFNIVISDTLSNFLQSATLQMIAASHSCKTTVKNNIIYFEFRDILLPDSNINEAKSHGFVAFRIKPKTNVAANTNIPNKAAIYFDYNTPVITNTAGTLIKDFSVIPLKLLSFSAVPQSYHSTNLYWNTANEINTKKFEAEESTDGSSFHYAGSITANGKMNNSYQLMISNPGNGIVYYRLKMIDNDGQFSYSPIIKINLRQTQGFSILSNPVKDYLIMSSTDPQLINTAAVLINSNGVVVKQFIVQPGSQMVPVKNLPAGIYYIKTIHGSSRLLIRN